MDDLSANNQGSAARLASQEALARALAALGYPGLAHLSPLSERKNPAVVLLAALRTHDLDSRLVEALPWVLWAYPELDWPWLLAAAKAQGLQNRLGFLVSLARQLAAGKGELDKAALLSRREAELEKLRLAGEDTLCHASLTAAERRWLRAHRSAAAKHWGLLADLAPEHLPYAA